MSGDLRGDKRAASAAPIPKHQHTTHPFMSTYVPLISSGVAGPLGALHLPRLWQKVSLEARGLLAPGYPGIGGGYDSMVIKALGLSPDAVKKYISEAKPTYPQF